MSLTHWVERIWAGLAIRSLDTVPSPWFLFPGEDQQELTEDEAQTLFADLRQRLFDHPFHPNVGAIKHRMGALSDEERIVLLYAMRYIALKGAGQNRYWPVCHTMLFAEKIALQRLQVELAPVLTEQWVRIYSRTKGRLFRPRQGKRNIKWPLSHAGLLVGDKQLLLQFRTDMAHKYSQEEFRLLLDADYLDDFLFELDAWLSHPDRRCETIAQNLQDGERGTITAELAQRFLEHQPDEVFQSFTRSDRGEFTRFDVIYNSSDNQLELRLTVQLASSSGALFVRWENGDFLSTPDVTGTRHTIVLPLRQAHLPESAPLMGAPVPQAIRIPHLTHEPLVFDGKSGRRVRQWQPGASYYVVLPPRYCADATQKQRDILFEIQQACGAPKGQWIGYQVFWVHLAGLSPAQGRTAEALNAAADALDLPGFEAHWQPQISLIGGRLMQTSDLPRYNAIDPPLIQVQGIWDFPLTLTYERWDEASKSFAVLKTIILPTQQDLHHHILRLPAPSTVLRQRHRLRVEDDVLSQWYTDIATPIMHPLRLTAILSVALAGEEITNPSYHHLIDGNLDIRAWSYAELILCGTDGNRQQQQVIQLGVEGHLSLPWRETALATLTSGTLRIQLLWNNLPVSPAITCVVEEATLSPDAVEVAFRINAPDTLDLIAELPHKHATRLLVLVLGLQPWNKQIWSQYIPVTRDGIVTTSIVTSRKDARWLAICMQHTVICNPKTGQVDVLESSQKEDHHEGQSVFGRTDCPDLAGG